MCYAAAGSSMRFLDASRILHVMKVCLGGCYSDMSLLKSPWSSGERCSRQRAWNSGAQRQSRQKTCLAPSSPPLSCYPERSRQTTTSEDPFWPSPLTLESPSDRSPTWSAAVQGVELWSMHHTSGWWLAAPLYMGGYVQREAVHIMMWTNGCRGNKVFLNC